MCYIQTTLIEEAFLKKGNYSIDIVINTLIIYTNINPSLRLYNYLGNEYHSGMCDFPNSCPTNMIFFHLPFNFNCYLVYKKDDFISYVTLPKPFLTLGEYNIITFIFVSPIITVSYMSNLVVVTFICIPFTWRVGVYVIYIRWTKRLFEWFCFV